MYYVGKEGNSSKVFGIIEEIVLIDWTIFSYVKLENIKSVHVLTKVEICVFFDHLYVHEILYTGSRGSHDPIDYSISRRKGCLGYLHYSD